MVMALAGLAHADEASDVLAKAQKFYAGADHLTASFGQETTNKVFNKTDTSQGKVYIRKPGNVRFDYSNKKGVLVKTLAFDGKTGWMVDLLNKRIQTTQATTTALPAAVSFLTGGNELAKQFTVALDSSGPYAVKDSTVLKLTPKTPSAQYKTLYFVVEPNDGHVRESVVVNANDDVNHFKFYAPDLKSQVDAGLFVLNKNQPGYTVTP